MGKGFFITGTDTGVGKTVITVAVLKVLELLGMKPSAMKPIETGCRREHDRLVPADGLFIKTEGVLKEDLRDISPCLFEHPLAPLAASFGWGWRAALSVALLFVAARFGDMVGGRGDAMLWLLFGAHQLIAVARVSLRAAWLANALRLVVGTAPTTT